MAALGVSFHATPSASASASSMACEFPSQSHGRSSSASGTFLDDFHPALDLSDFTSVLDHASEFAPSSFAPLAGHEYQPPVSTNMLMDDQGSRGDCFGNFCNEDDIDSADMISDAELGGNRPRNETSRIAFRMKSQVEILDDGFKWRKYGKKSVKNSPNPRNYYRCSTEGCSVKKRVERDKEDPTYVITTYDGIHNHMSPGVVYYASRDTFSGRYFVSGCSQISSSAAAATAASSS